MKTHKLIFWITLLLSVLFISISTLLNYYYIPNDDFLVSLFLGIGCSLIVVTLIELITYFYFRRKYMDELSDKLISAYTLTYCINSVNVKMYNCFLEGKYYETDTRDIYEMFFNSFSTNIIVDLDTEYIGVFPFKTKNTKRIIFFGNSIYSRFERINILKQICREINHNKTKHKISELKGNDKDLNINDRKIYDSLIRIDERSNALNEEIGNLIDEYALFYGNAKAISKTLENTHKSSNAVINDILGLYEKKLESEENQ